MQRYSGPSRRMLLACSVALCATVACSSNNTNNNKQNSTESPAPNAARSTTEAAPPAPTPQPVSLTGCLQEGSGDTYILTELNKPKQPDSSNPSVVASEKLAAANEAYRLTSQRENDLSTFVGRRVQVEGTVTRPSDLAANTTPSGATGTAGQNSEPNAAGTGHAISEKDLAEVQVSSVKKVANTCGGRSAGAKHSNRR
jgi:hypothetical protein